MTVPITAPIREFEAKLPPIAKQMLRLNVAVGFALFGTAKKVSSIFWDAKVTSFERAARGVRTTAGQSRSAAGRSSEAITDAATVTSNAVKEVAGQARAQADIAVETTRSEVSEAIDRVIDVVEDAPSGAYEYWTKQELYERAQELDLKGRSSMSKNELIAALRSK